MFYKLKSIFVFLRSISNIYVCMYKLVNDSKQHDRAVDAEYTTMHQHNQTSNFFCNRMAETE